MRFLLLTLYLIAMTTVAAQNADDNVIVTQETSTYHLREKNGRLSGVKAVNTKTFLARRADATALAVTFFNNDISVDKASAPGAKPQYRAWESDDLFYDGSRVCYLKVPLKKNKEARAVMERTYKTPEQFCEIMLTSPYYTENARYEINVPSKLSETITITPMYLPEGVKLQREISGNGDVTYIVELVSRNGSKNEPLAPSPSISSPKLMITGLFRNVAELYSFMHGTILPDNGDTAPLAAQAAAIVDGLDNDFDRAAAIACWVRLNIRYLAVEHGEYAFRPDHASAVFQKRYGDCKGSANLIKAMLRSVGIDGRLAWIGTAGRVDTDWTEIPSVASGNHMIAAAVLPDTILYLDGTASYCPRGYYTPGITGRQVIIEDGDNFIISRVPENAIGSDRYSFNASFRIDGTDITGTVEHRLSGVYRYAFENACNGRDASRRDDFVRAYLTPPKRTVEWGNISVAEVAPDASETCLTADVVEKKAVSTVDGKMYLDLRPLRNITLKPVAEKGRSKGIRLTSGFKMTASIDVAVPEGYKIDPATEGCKKIDSRWFKGWVMTESTPDGIRCTAEVNTGETEASLGAVPEWNKALRDMINISNTQIALIKQ